MTCKEKTEGIFDVSAVGSRGYWILFTWANGIKRPLDLEYDGMEVLPLFSFREEADLYLKYGARVDPKATFRVERRDCGEVLNLIFDRGICQRNYVALDPVPEIINGFDPLPLTLIPTRSFLGGFL